MFLFCLLVGMRAFILTLKMKAEIFPSASMSNFCSVDASWSLLILDSKVIVISLISIYGIGTIVSNEEVREVDITIYRKKHNIRTVSFIMKSIDY